EFLDEVGTFQDDATTRVLGGELAEIFQKSRVAHRLVKTARVADGFNRKLNDRTGFDVAPRANVMADAGRHRAERLAAVVVVGIDDRDGHLGAHFDDKALNAHELIRAQSELEVWLWPHRAVRVIPDVMR